MAPSFAQMSTSDPMAVQKALASLHLSPLMMLVTLFSNSTATIGKAARSKYVRIVLLVSALVLVAVEADLVHVADLEVDLEVEVALEVVADSEADSVVVVAVTVVVMVELLVVVSTAELEQWLQCPIHLPTMPLLGRREARSSTFVT
jgi:hypothetical protein